MADHLDTITSSLSMFLEIGLFRLEIDTLILADHLMQVFLQFALHKSMQPKIFLILRQSLPFSPPLRLQRYNSL